MASSPLHILFFPYMAPGHLLPMLDIANLFCRRGILVTVITTPASASQVEQYIAHNKTPMRHHFLPFPPGWENFSSVTSQLNFAFLLSLPHMRDPFSHALAEIHPDCIVTDMFLPWTRESAEEFNIPRINFAGTNYFFNCAIRTISQHIPNTDTVVLPGFPHFIQMLKSQLDEIREPMLGIFQESEVSESKSYGVIVNSFYELEPGYVDYHRNVVGMKSWHIGPVADISAREHESSHECLKWLDAKSSGSVMYICFGSQRDFTAAQLREIALGLEKATCAFIWVVSSVTDEWVPEGYEERLKGRGMVVKGWAPQMMILNHVAVGGFLTHCGWNSCLEGISAGKAMVTWPAFADQFYNERLIVDVLRIGVAVGVKVSVTRVGEREVIGAGMVTAAVEEVMGSDDEAEERRRRVKDLAVAAKRAVEIGGSSYAAMSKFIEEMTQRKNGNLDKSI